MLPVRCDVSTQAGVDELIGRAVQQFGGLDILVNNVGLARGADLMATSDAEWQEAFDQTLYPAIRASRAAVPHMKARGGGVILMIASIFGRETGGRMTYNAVKAAEISLAKSLAQQLAKDNIRVNSVGFGTVKVKFNTDVELAELNPPTSGTIKARGTGQGNTANVVARFVLADGEDRTTDLNWTADVTIVGNIAGMATRLMGSVTQNLSGKFFECMKAQVEVAEGVIEAPVAQPGFFAHLIQAIRRFFARLFGRAQAESQ